MTNGGPAITIWNMKGSFLRIRFDLSSNFGLLWESYLFNHFFSDLIPKWEVFKFLNQLTHFNHQFKLLTFTQTMP
jgi:hypothetical protein